MAEDGEEKAGKEEGGGPMEAAARDLERAAHRQERREADDGPRDAPKAAGGETQEAPPPHEGSPPPRPRKGLLGRGAEALSTTGRVLAILWLLAVTLYLARSVWTTLSGVQIGGDFEVPAALAAQGYTGSVAKDLLAEKVRGILESARRSGRPEAETEEALFLDEGSDEELSDLKIPGTGMSVQSVVALILADVGRAPRQVSGGLVQSPSGTTLRLAIFDGPSAEIASPVPDCSGDCLNDLIEQGARRVAQRISSVALVAYLLDRDPKACEEAIRYSLRTRPADDDAAAYNYWGILLKRQGDLEGAQQKLAQALELAKTQGANPRFEASIENNWGLVMAGQKNFPEARRHLAAAMAADSSFARAHHNMGVIAQAEGRLDEAAAEFGKATDRDAHLGGAYLQQAEALARLHRGAEALRLLEKAEALGFGRRHEAGLDLALYLTWARTLDSMGKRDEALVKAERAVDIAPDSPEARQLVAELQVKAQRKGA